jgi:hypothetical protein
MATNYAYSVNVPQSSQKISATQAPIQSNFQAINELLNINHVGFYDPVNFGKHTYTSFPIQMSDPATTSTEMAVYAKSSTDANGIELFYRYPSNGTVVQLTAGGSTSVSGNNGYSYLTTTLLLKWGIATINTTGATVVTFPVSGPIPAFTTSCYFVQFTPAGNYALSNSGSYITNITTTTFTFNAPSGGMSSTIYWIAMGV